MIRGGFVGRLVSNDFTAALVQAEILRVRPLDRREAPSTSSTSTTASRRCAARTLPEPRRPGAVVCRPAPRRDPRQLHQADHRRRERDREREEESRRLKGKTDDASVAQAKILTEQIAAFERQIAECPVPSGFIHKISNMFGGDDSVPNCGEYANDVKKQLPTMELNYGPVVGSY